MPCPARRHLALAALGVLIAIPSVVGASPLRGDEEVLFFRNVVPVEPEAGSWPIEVRGWVFEPERSSVTRRLLLRGLARALRLPAGSDAEALFRSRAEMFLVDSERGNDIAVRIGPATYPLPASGSDGLFGGTLAVRPTHRAPGANPVWVRYSAALPGGDSRRFEGQVQLAPPSGPAVISDIDDTIKVTVVRDRKEMLRNTFVRPFTPVAGMASAYARWAGAGAVFFYVSGSPWQLYPSLVRFMDDSGFPAGGIHLRNVWRRGALAPDLDAPPEQHKIPAIEGILSRHLGRTFVLVGDSGERDPEIYGEIARRHPARVRRILIRKAPLADERPGRYETAFRGLARGLWAVFAEPDLPADPFGD